MESMTGFGRGEFQGEGFGLQVEVKSLNHRFMEIVCRLPRRYQVLEERLRREIQARFHRGRFEVQVRLVGTPPATARVFVDRSLLSQYLAHLRSLSAEWGLSGELSVSDLLRLKEIFVLAEETPEVEALWTELSPPFFEALEQLSRMRRREGEYLREVLYAHLRELDVLLDRIASLKEGHLSEALRRLEDRLSKLLAERGLDPVRLHQEAAILADRLDFTEELDRLRSHRRHFEEVMESPGPHGRKLDFLCQEMFREINTLSNKAASAEISRLAVEVKALIEKLREQVQNLE
ncbi:YicC/YloC family endoribonuclease [Thermosulfurimonas sp. F29]|uniref:YicC/YloC family endoribonuclease n=1 Tax=Thermosulfurimonas sp. F29 TaxID=2867247 RepID=UPI001C82A36A|nr:YicC/YloC family endoribonuclease [Thermosulfurimonas sp. F29]MBX6423861.1 YicC family protein [Thermosulfurimonas sp. F29]